MIRLLESTPAATCPGQRSKPVPGLTIDVPNHAESVPGLPFAVPIHAKSLQWHPLHGQHTRQSPVRGRMLQAPSGSAQSRAAVLHELSFHMRSVPGAMSLAPDGLQGSAEPYRRQAQP